MLQHLRDDSVSSVCGEIGSASAAAASGPLHLDIWMFGCLDIWRSKLQRRRRDTTVKGECWPVGKRQLHQDHHQKPSAVTFLVGKREAATHFIQAQRIPCFETLPRHFASLLTKSRHSQIPKRTPEI
jgi:hypothetical protein